MKLTQQEFQQRYGNIGQATIQPQQPNQQTTQSPRGFIGGVQKVGDFLGMKEFGAGLGEAMATGSKDFKIQSESERGLRDVTQKLIDRANKYQPGDPRRDTFLKMAQENYKQLGDTSTEYTNRLPTTKQFLGSAVQTGLNVATAGMGGGKLLPQMAKFSAVGAGYGASQGFKEGKDIYGIARDAVIGGLISAAVPGVLKGTGALLKAGGNFIKNILRVSTSTSPEALETLMTNKSSKIGMRGGKQYFRTLFDDVRKKANKMINTLNSEYGQKLEALHISNPKPVQLDTNAIGKQLIKTAEDFGVKPTVKGLNFSQAGKINSSIEQKNIQKAYNIMRDWKDFSIKGLNSLRQKIGELAEYDTTSLSGKASSSLVKRWGKIITTSINDAVPELKAINSEYGVKIKIIQDTREFLKAYSQNPEKVTTAWNKFAGLFNKENQGILIDMFKKYEQQSGQEVLGRLAGQEFRSFMPAIFEKSGARTATGKFGLLPPRLVGETMYKVGRAKNIISNIAKNKVVSGTSRAIRTTGRLGLFNLIK